MSSTEFAMVEELAFLIKDNLPRKHLVLSMEEAFINFLQDDPSSGGLLELEPMDSYNRLLLHRLADIFGFSHGAVGEGNKRRLILERCPDSSVPSILVSDLLWQYDELPPETTSHQVLRRDHASPALKSERTNVQFSFEEREAEYLAARERIFARFDGENDDDIIKQKPKSDPVVARRMIAHALGRNMRSSTESIGQKVSNRNMEKTSEMNIQERNLANKNFSPRNRGTNVLSGQSQPMNRHVRPKASNSKGRASLPTPKKVDLKQAEAPSAKPGAGRKPDIKEEHMGAAKRLFAHALKFQSAKDDVPSKRSGLRQAE